ncbi:transcriptional repressor CTCFL-like [Cloeon dipterum]|uniref:transcriptional repressor CTCFL-like n=1 Tax=Cloeon dipterum TaxID=197152 RepID=UPI0032209348
MVLEVVDLTKYEREIPKKSGACLYCCKRFNVLRQHIRMMHKEAIKCGIKGCTTYFQTEEEKERHMQKDFHEKQIKPCESRKIRCKYCVIIKLYSKVKSWREHMRRKHPKLVACTQYGCKGYFKSKPEMILHVNSFHKRGKNQDLFECEHCEYFTKWKHLMVLHQQAKHIPKKFKCDSCDVKFGSKGSFGKHIKQYHKFDKCKSCGKDVALGLKRRHRRGHLFAPNANSNSRALLREIIKNHQVRVSSEAIRCFEDIVKDSDPSKLACCGKTTALKLLAYVIQDENMAKQSFRSSDEGCTRPDLKALNCIQGVLAGKPHQVWFNLQLLIKTRVSHKNSVNFW